MAVLSDLVSRVRLELGDQSKQFSLTFVGDGAKVDFALGIKHIELENLLVEVDGTPVLHPTEYTVEVDNGVLHFAHAPEADSAIVVTGLAYRYFIDEDITRFVNTAVGQHTNNRTDSMGSLMTVDSIPAVEEYPIAILASIEGLWVLATDSAFDIDIQAPDGVNIPRSERYRQLTQMIQLRTEQYKSLCSALNIGLWKIEMGTLRRVSRATNKLTPVYMPQEFDDSRRPERVYIQNDLNGRTPFPSTVQTYDIKIYQGDSWSQPFQFPFDITNLDLKAQIRTYPNAPALYATFDIEKINSTTARLTLTTSATAYLPPRAFWDLQATDPAVPTYEKTHIRGQVFTTQQVTLD